MRSVLGIGNRPLKDCYSFVTDENDKGRMCTSCGLNVYQVNLMGADVRSETARLCAGGWIVTGNMCKTGESDHSRQTRAKSPRAIILQEWHVPHVKIK